ncbi:MAG: phosphoribosylformylglycinamidine synthase I [Chloroflexi bacterium UTCFX4]|jgi:phosphoribosylformylglycinamidine synthase|nr:MAG: phosphoribosylformylglycinamidine synthase I [Chloroflexi bacterium UTCFX4]
MKPHALILHAPGTNRDHEAALALEHAGALAEIVPFMQLRAREKYLRDYQMLVLPGGFAYADALGAGKLLALELVLYFADAVNEFIASGKPVIGICNGFQALVKAGILPGNQLSVNSHQLSVNSRQFAVNSEQLAVNSEQLAVNSEQLAVSSLQSPISHLQSQATLTFNARGHFECRWVTLNPVSQKCVWTRGLDELIYCPVAHGEGNFQLAEEKDLATLRAQEQIALHYVCENGDAANGVYPFNPNGSRDDIAGVCNERGNVLGLMPHPENHIFDFQHPRHTRGERGRLGLRMFENGVRYAGEI